MVSWVGVVKGMGSFPGEAAAGFAWKITTRCQASWLKVRVTDKSLGNQWLEKEKVSVGQAAFFPPLLLGCHRALSWRGCQAYIKALNRYMSAEASREFEIWLQAVRAHPWCCSRAPPCLHPCLAALPALPAVHPGCPDLLRQGRAVWRVDEEARGLS